MSTLAAILKIGLFALISLVLGGLQSLFLLFHKGQYAYIIPRLYHNLVCRALCISIKIEGKPLSGQQTLFISNHLSYLDIPVLGGIIKSASFVAKDDVRGWPLFGYLSTLQQTAFISRDPSNVTQGANTLDSMLRGGKSLILFPEGTSTDGRDVMPFKSSLFSIAYMPGLQSIQIQPVTIIMDRVDGRRVDSQIERDLYAWHVNMETELGPHIWMFAKSKGAIIRVIFHEPFPAQRHSDRKTLAKACFDTVSKPLHNDLTPTTSKE